MSNVAQRLGESPQGGNSAGTRLRNYIVFRTFGLLDIPRLQRISGPMKMKQTLPLISAPSQGNIYPSVAEWAGCTTFYSKYDPASGAETVQVPMASGADVVTATQKAAAWQHQEQAGAAQVDRLAILERLISEITARHEVFAQAISEEMGAPVDFAREKQVDTAVAHLRVILNAARNSVNEYAPDPAMPGHLIRHEPYGVAALITPWNWPLNQVALKVGAALAAGCAMVLKPSEHAPHSALLFAEAMARAGAPGGLFALCLGDGTVGATLVEQPDVAVVSFTGSTDVGRWIAGTAGAALKPVLLELGGKSANILFDDCDVETAVQQGVAHCFRNSGQSCNAASRMLAARPIYDRVVELAAKEAVTYAFDAPKQAGGHLGPLVSQPQYDRVQTCISNAISDGARLIAGGGGGITPGHFTRATVFADVTPQMRLFHDEVFGPVLAITPFETEDDAITLANATQYGLAAYIQTGSPERALRVSRRLSAGMIQINGQSRANGAPFGGVKNSGFGREAGLWGIRAFQSIKSVSGV